MIKQYRKKPVVIEAIQFTGNNEECIAFCPTAINPVDNKPSLIIPTLEGNHICSVGDYIIMGVKGEFYPCKPDIFTATYEPMDGEKPSEEPCPDCRGIGTVCVKPNCREDCYYPEECEIRKPCPRCSGKSGEVE